MKDTDPFEKLPQGCSLPQLKIADLSCCTSVPSLSNFAPKLLQLSCNTLALESPSSSSVPGSSSSSSSSKKQRRAAVAAAAAKMACLTHLYCRYVHVLHATSAEDVTAGFKTAFPVLR